MSELLTDSLLCLAWFMVPTICSPTPLLPSWLLIIPMVISCLQHSTTLCLCCSMLYFLVISSIDRSFVQLNWVLVEFKLSYFYDLYLFFSSSGMIDLKELSLVGGKAAWMAYLVRFYMCCIYQSSVINHRNNAVYGVRYFIFLSFECLVLNY